MCKQNNCRSRISPRFQAVFLASDSRFNNTSGRAPNSEELSIKELLHISCQISSSFLNKRLQIREYKVLRFKNTSGRAPDSKELSIKELVRYFLSQIKIVILFGAR